MKPKGGWEVLTEGGFWLDFPVPLPKDTIITYDDGLVGYRQTEVDF